MKLLKTKKFIFFMLGFGLIFMQSCKSDDDNKPLSTNADITALTLTIDKADYKISFDKEGKATIKLPSKVKIDDKTKAKVKTLTLSEGTTASVSMVEELTLKGKQLTITVKAEDNKTEKVYRIAFENEASSEADENESSSEPDTPITLTDREILIKFFKANPGNELGWNIDSEDISKWQGVEAEPIAGEDGFRVVKLDVSANYKSIQKVIPEIGDLSELKELDLSRQGLTEIPKEIGKLGKLEILTLRFNDLTTLPKELGKLSNLKTLDLSVNNSLTRLPDSFEELKRLRQFGASHCNLSSFPKFITKIPSIRWLNLQNNKGITELPPEIRNLTNLNTINMRFCGLTSIPAEIGKTNLLIAQFSFNKIRTIPKEMGNLPILTEFLLSSNEIEVIPKELFNAPRLKTLDLFDNKLKSVPSEIELATNLKTLDLSFNKGLTVLPGSIGKLKSLETLEANGCSLNKIPKEISEATALKELILDDNQLTELDKAFAKLDLEQLELYDNKITSLSKELCDKFPFVRKADNKEFYNAAYRIDAGVTCKD